MSQEYMYLYLKNWDFFSPWGCLKPRDWGILQCSRYLWLWHNLLYNGREACKVRDLQVREKSIETVLRACNLLFQKKILVNPALAPKRLGCRLESWEVQPASTHRLLRGCLGLCLLIPHSSPSTEARESPFHTITHSTLLSWCPIPNSRSYLMKFSPYLSSFSGTNSDPHMSLGL